MTDSDDEVPEPVQGFSYQPKFDAPSAVADTSSIGPTHIRTSWEVPPTARNRTYISLRTDETEEIPAYTGDKNHYDLVRPNYKRLELVNRGFWNGKWERKENLHPDDDWRLAHAIMCQLEMTGYQKRRFHHLFWKLDRGEIGLSTEKVTFGVCMVVCWEDGRKASPAQKPWDSEFRRFATEQGYQKPHSLFGKMESKLRPWLKDRNERRKPPKPLTSYGQGISRGKVGA